MHIIYACIYYIRQRYLIFLKQSLAIKQELMTIYKLQDRKEKTNILKQTTIDAMFEKYITQYIILKIYNLHIKGIIYLFLNMNNLNLFKVWIKIY